MSDSAYFTTLDQNPELLRPLCQMSAGSPEQNRSLTKLLSGDKSLWPQTYLYTDGHRVLGRVLVQECQLLCLTLETVSPHRASAFLRDVLARHPGQALETHLYSDKANLALTADALTAAGFLALAEKESYTGQSGRIRQSTPLTFAPLDTAHLTPLMLGRLPGTLDRMMGREAARLGPERAAENTVRQLRQMGEDPGLWRMALLEGVPVGFVIVSNFGDGLGAVNEIGVLPEYRGRRCGLHLIRHALDRAYRSGIHTLIADIDRENPPMRRALLEAGFVMSTLETVYGLSPDA